MLPREVIEEFVGRYAATGLHVLVALADTVPVGNRVWPNRWLAVAPRRARRFSSADRSGSRFAIASHADPPVCDLARARVFEGSFEQSGGAPFVPVMETADLGNRHDPAVTGRRDAARNRRVLVEREMCAGAVVVIAVETEQTLEPGRAEHDDVIEAFSSGGSDEPLDIRILPCRAWCREDFLNPQRFAGVRPSVERVIAIPQEIAWRVVPRKCLAEFVRRPRRGRMVRDADVHNPATLVREDHQHE
jgi:hypothetical protein